MDYRTYFGVRGEPVRGLTCNDKSRTRQEFLKESLTSTIVERFAATGVLTPTVNTERIAQFGDFSECPGDLLEASERIRNVRELFESFSPEIRAQFSNNPLVFVQFMSNPSNRSKAIEMGFIAKPVEPKPVEPKPVELKPVEVKPVVESNSDNLKE